LALLAECFGKVDHSMGLVGASTARPQVSMAQRTVPKKEESTIGADLCVVVHAHLPGSLVIRFGDLVQVKKTNLLTAPRGRADSWKVDVPQLRKLLHQSATAVYWLIRRSGDILIVPAKLVAALNAGQDTPGLGSFTIRYSEVRHVAVPLDQYICDLLLGMWLGTADAYQLDVIDGTSGRTKPRTILDITVRRPQG
jgi:hypothetical protein